MVYNRSRPNFLIHPDFEFELYKNDLGLIQLDELYDRDEDFYRTNFGTGRTKILIRLPDRYGPTVSSVFDIPWARNASHSGQTNLAEHERLVITGYGYTINATGHAEIPDLMQYAEINIVFDHAMCLFIMYVDAEEKVFCVSGLVPLGEDRGYLKDGCQGDDGTGQMAIIVTYEIAKV